MLRVNCGLLAGVLGVVCLGGWSPVQGANGPAITDVQAAQADPDFGTQGEYAGWLVTPQGYLEWTGVQVIALGKGEFGGMLYRGGLPGNGWDRTHRAPLKGARQGEVVTLVLEDRTATIAQGTLTFRDAAGCVLGSLGKCHRYSPTLGAVPPAQAKVLFDGTDARHFKNGKLTDDGLLMIGADTLEPVRDFSLHLEFRTPYMPEARGQGRANSGVYIQGRYEVQILDSFGLEGVANECGGLYKTQAPSQNMAFPPLTWQTYDIDFRAARFNEQGEKTQNAVITVRLNGVPVHENYEIPNKTGAGAAEGPTPGPIRLQNHGNPVHFRNIWLVNYSEAPECAPAAPAECAPCVPCAPRRGLFSRLRRCR